MIVCTQRSGQIQCRNEISVIIARRLLNVATDKEKEVLSKWMNRSPENKSFVKSMEAYWKKNPEELQDKKIHLSRERLLARLSQNSKEYRPKTVLFYLSRIAAAVIIMASIAGLSVYIASESGVFLLRQPGLKFLTDAGQQSKVLLPDGSLVYLNTETKVEYSEKGK